MLDAVGAGSVKDLFSDIPPDIILDAGLDLPGHLSEFEVYNNLQASADKNIVGVSFLGGGVYDHLIPAVVSSVVSRSEFLTAYTPYQAEMSQGILQAMFEYQTLICALTGLDVSNASLYDGATAAAEACALAVNSVRGAGRLLYSPTIYPQTIEVLKTFFSSHDVELVCMDSVSGVAKLSDLERYIAKGVAGVLVQSPNRYGCVEDYTGFADAAHAAGAKLIVSANPISLGLLKSPGEWGADVAVGDGQPCGLSQNYGGPGVGYICATRELMRKMPGRIVGETEDADGERAFVLTLQAREQHIKRERATSNICTNQALAALGVAAYLACLGPKGIREVAHQSHSKARYLYEKLVGETAAEPVFTKQFFNEFVLRLPVKSGLVVERMVNNGFHPGIPLDGVYDGSEFDLLIAVTEKRTREELDGYVETLKRVIV